MSNLGHQGTCSDPRLPVSSALEALQVTVNYSKFSNWHQLDKNLPLRLENIHVFLKNGFF